MPYKYIGRTNDFKGKTLWEILGNLKNLGVGRIIGRNRFQRYPEPCYIKIRKVEVLPDRSDRQETRKVITLVDRVFRGRKSDNLVQMESATYKADYFLVPKHQEEEFCRPAEVKPIKIFPSSMEFPPLLKELILRQQIASGKSSDGNIKMKIVYNKTNKHYRWAEEGETPTEEEPVMGVGKTNAPRLYPDLCECIDVTKIVSENCNEENKNNSANAN